MPTIKFTLLKTVCKFGSTFTKQKTDYYKFQSILLYPKSSQTQ